MYPMTPPPGRATVLFNCGVALMQRKDTEAALKHFDEIVSLCNPVPHVVISSRSIALSRLGRLDEALEEADKSVLLNPECATGFHVRAVALHEMARLSRRSWPEAMRAYQDVLQISPGHKTAKMGLENCVRERMNARRKERARQTEVHVRLTLLVIPAGTVGTGHHDSSVRVTGFRVLAACRALEVPVDAGGASAVPDVV